MSSGYFSALQFVLDSSGLSSISFKRKQEIRNKITANGGTISYILAKKTNFVLTADGANTLSSYKGRTAIKYGIPVVHVDFVEDCSMAGQCLDPGPHLLSETAEAKEFSSGKIVTVKSKETEERVKKKGRPIMIPKTELNKISIWSYKSAEGPDFPEVGYEIAKDMTLQRVDDSGKVLLFYALELHVVPARITSEGPRYRVFSHHGNFEHLKEGNVGLKECRYLYSAEQALGTYIALYEQAISPPHSLTRYWGHLSSKIGSDKMKEQIINTLISGEGSSLSPEVAGLVDYLWDEAVGCLTDTLSVPLESIKLQKVLEAEAILLSMKEKLADRQDCPGLETLWKEFCALIPHTCEDVQFDKSLIAEKQSLCQLIRDVLNVSEATSMSRASSRQAKYTALRCHIEHLADDDDEYLRIEQYLFYSQTRSNDIAVLNIFALHRPVEETNFTHHIGEQKLLFHASRVRNFVGILSRGLLLPKIVVDDLGGKRSDPGMLGSGIYFASSASTSAQYSSAGRLGSRFMLVNEVALGRIKKYKHFAKELTCAPEGYDSVHGVAGADGEPSDFKDDEFVVYNNKQQQMRYLVEFALPKDDIFPRDNVSLDSGFVDEKPPSYIEGNDVDLSDVMSIPDPLSKVEAGLKGIGDHSVPLQAVHIRATLLDLAAQVVIMQSYKNNSSVPIEAKYVFPLDDMAAVCGFEAFINGKHIIGEVKEKEQAHREYREAISQGHGAYLMDEETPDVFTVNVGNLPPNASVLIKITYVAELTVEGENICFALPGSVAPWKRSQALDEITQTDVETVCVEKEQQNNTSIQVAIEMPFEIRTIQCPTHPIQIKRTSTKAVVEMDQGCQLGDGFQLLIELAEIHVPRMWVEKHDTETDSQASMLAFYPEFEAEPPEEVEIMFLLDASCSMKGSALQEAKKIVLMCLSLMSDSWAFNIVVFGSSHSELFPHSQKKNQDTLRMATDFVKSVVAVKGSTDLWHVLRCLYLLPCTSTADHPRNVFLISDGYATEESTTLTYIRDNRQDSRVFTFGVGSTSNRHFLRSMARVGAGASEFFDSKSKSKWERKVKAQLSKAEQPGLTSVSVAWQQHDSCAKTPVQAPHDIVSLFSGSRQVIYGLVDNCTQASLTAEVNGRIVSTMVSTSDLNITTGKILHQLTVRAIIRDWEDGSLDRNDTIHEVVKRDRKDYIISLSKEFSIVSQFTSFVAIEHREKDETFEESLGPSIEELVSEENVDIIPYVSWEAKERKTEDKPKLNLAVQVTQVVEEAKVLERCSVLQAEYLYKQACSTVVEAVLKTRNSVSSNLVIKAFFSLAQFYLDVIQDQQKALAALAVLQVLRDNAFDSDDISEEAGKELLNSFGEELASLVEIVQVTPQRKSSKTNILAIFPASDYKWCEKAVVDNLSESSSESSDRDMDLGLYSSSFDSDTSKSGGECFGGTDDDTNYDGLWLGGEEEESTNIARNKAFECKEFVSFGAADVYDEYEVMANSADVYDEIYEVMANSGVTLGAQMTSDEEEYADLDMKEQECAMKAPSPTLSSAYSATSSERLVKAEAFMKRKAPRMQQPFRREELLSQLVNRSSETLPSSESQAFSASSPTSFPLSQVELRSRKRSPDKTAMKYSAALMRDEDEFDYLGDLSEPEVAEGAVSAPISQAYSTRSPTYYPSSPEEMEEPERALKPEKLLLPMHPTAKEVERLAKEKSEPEIRARRMRLSATDSKAARPEISRVAVDKDSEMASPHSDDRTTDHDMPVVQERESSVFFIQAARRAPPPPVPLPPKRLKKLKSSLPPSSDVPSAQFDMQGLNHHPQLLACSDPPLPPRRSGTTLLAPPPPLLTKSSQKWKGSLPPSSDVPSAQLDMQGLNHHPQLLACSAPPLPPPRPESTLLVPRPLSSTSRRTQELLSSLTRRKAAFSGPDSYRKNPLSMLESAVGMGSGGFGAAFVSPPPRPRGAVSACPLPLAPVDVPRPSSEEVSFGWPPASDFSLPSYSAFSFGVPPQRRVSGTPSTSAIKPEKRLTSTMPITLKQDLTLQLPLLFKHQDPEGFWAMTNEVLDLVGIDSTRCVHLLKEAGARSLGETVYLQILKLVATVVILTILKLHFPKQFPVSFVAGDRINAQVEIQWREQVERALSWLKVMDRKIPSIYSRLELGSNWETAAVSIIDKVDSRKAVII